MNGGSGEEAFLERLIASRPSAPDLLVPIGDDAAVFRPPPGFDIVVAADAIAEGSHFFPDTAPEAIGRKALAVNLSDFAAMGALPRFAFATASLPRGFRAEYADRITAGLRALADEFGVILAGGDTITHDGPCGISVTVAGYVEPGGAIRRDGARPGDLIVVTGPLGGSLPFGRHLTFRPQVALGRRLREAGPPSAMMDLSDGLGLDLARLCRRSGVGARLEAERIPVHDDARRAGGDPLARALSDGEDFELLFTVAPEVWKRLLPRLEGFPHPTVVGEILDAPGIRLLRNGVEAPLEPRGHVHA
jgi:thiamine-monophosphate kinase